jgi:hypothetical protein
MKREIVKKGDRKPENGGLFMPRQRHVAGENSYHDSTTDTTMVP